MIFRSNHLNTGYVFGRFDAFEGTATVENDQPTAFNVKIQVQSINSGNPKRDGHLKSPDFFSANEFPTIEFKSTSVKQVSDGKYEVAGDLTMHGQTKPITINVEKVGQSSTQQFGPRIGYAASFTVKRSDFGIAAMPQVVGDDVLLMVGFETTKG